MVSYNEKALSELLSKENIDCTTIYFKNRLLRAKSWLEKYGNSKIKVLDNFNEDYYKDLTDEEVAALRKEVEKYTTEGDLRRDVQLSIKAKMEINSYEGTRHKKGLPVRGQRTSRNARTRKGKGKVVANKKKVGK